MSLWCVEAAVTDASERLGGMHDVFDRLENRTCVARETALFRDLQHILGMAKGRAPALRAQLKGVDVARLRGRTALARIPLRRRADLLLAQGDAAPLGGFVASRIAALAHVFTAPGTVSTAGGTAKDWWGMGRAFYAAGLRKGALVLNAYPYDLVPDGHMAEAGARALACPVLPAGHAEPAQIAEAAARFRPSFFCGTAERLRMILDAGLERGVDLSSLGAALVTGSLKFGLRRELALRGLALRHALVLPETGLVAYESGASEGMTLAENLILELIDPDTGTLAAPDAEGEMVVTRINRDAPLLRFATGIRARLLDQSSTCGRTNTRLILLAEASSGEARHCDDGAAPPSRGAEAIAAAVIHH